MKNNINKKVSVEVHRIELKEWFEDSSLITHALLREMRYDHEMSPLDLILEQDEVFLIRYTALNSENRNPTINEPRTFITDKEHIIDFTLVDIITKLEGCHTEEIGNYPPELDDLITEYCFGSGFYKLSLEEEYLKFKKYKHIDLSIPYFDEKIEKEIKTENNGGKMYKTTKKELLFLSSLKIIFDHFDRGEMINLDEIYWQFGEPENLSPIQVLSTPFFNQLTEQTETEFALKPKQVSRVKRGKLYAHKEIAWYYLTILCEDIVLDKSFWEAQNATNDPQYAIEDIDGRIERYEEIFQAYRGNADSRGNIKNQGS